ncbi:MAG: hypothetical protein RIK87_05700 [Fuerstiella sp.]
MSARKTQPTPEETPSAAPDHHGTIPYSPLSSPATTFQSPPPCRYVRKRSHAVRH